MMADEKNSCKKCTELEVILHKKNCEIERLEVQIKNLKTFLRDNETQTKFCQLCSVTDKLEIDTIEEPDVSISQAKINNKERLEAATDILHSQSSRKNFAMTDDIENQHSSETLQNNSLHVEVSNDASNQNKTFENENSSDYIYDENLKMYYCPSTGYYYDHKSKLFYLPQTRAYYSYNYSKGEYDLCETTSSDELLKEDCDSVLDKVNGLNISDNDFASTDDEKLRNNFQQVAGSSENKETLDDEMLEGFTEDWKTTEGSNATVKDLVRNVAEQTCGMSDYIYDENSAMYYSKSTGHYYDPVKKLLYDPQTKVYYLYIEETASYEFYCKADEAESMSLLPKHDPLKRNHKKKSKKQWGKKVFSSEKGEELPKDDITEMDENDAEETRDSPEEGEIVSTTDSDSDSDYSTENTPSFGPPCIRAIVKKSAKLKNGSLILITCTGAIIGREKFNTIHVPDIGVSKAHAEITFNNDSWKYTIEDLGSQNGTFVNDVRLSEPKQKSEPLTLNHGDSLTLGSCELLLHIHEGYITCDKCEPGQVLAEISAQEVKPVAILKSKEEKEKERREEMSRLKKKYGLKGIEYVSGKKPVVSSSKYEDKAEIRRKTVGSQNPYEKTEVASMQERITKSNKGFQMLQKLGWKEGDSLGLNGSGISEPIPLRPWLSKAGLGSSVSEATSQPLNPQLDKRKQKWVKAQERYLQLT